MNAICGYGSSAGLLYLSGWKIGKAWLKNATTHVLDLFSAATHREYICHLYQFVVHSRLAQRCAAIGATIQPDRNPL